MTFSARWRRLFLVLHVATSVGFPGAVAAFLVLAVTGAVTSDTALARGVYSAVAVMTWQAIVPLAIAALLIGLIQSLGTPWGLFRHYWLIVKLALTLVALGVLLLQIQTIDMLSATALKGNLADMNGPRAGMIVHATGGLVVLVAATVLSIYKPRGLTPYGARRLASAA